MIQIQQYFYPNHSIGRQKKLFDQEAEDLKDNRRQGILIKELMKEYGLSKASIYLYLGGSENI